MLGRSKEPSGDVHPFESNGFLRDAAIGGAARGIIIGEPLDLGTKFPGWSSDCSPPPATTSPQQEFAKDYKTRDKHYIREKGTHIIEQRLAGCHAVVPARHFRCGGSGFPGSKFE
jgi:hypothetical protein